MKDLNDPEKIKKLKKLLSDINRKHHLGNILGGSIHINKGISKVISERTKETIKSFQKQFCDEITCKRSPKKQWKIHFLQ